LGRAQRENSAGQLKNRNDAVMDQALASAQRALKLDDSLAEAHLAVGSIFWMDWKVEDASREFRTAVALNPSDATAHQRLGRALLTDGRIDEALVALRRAHELEPLFARIADNYSIALIGARRFEEAVAMADRALALQPELRQGLAYKAVALAEMGRTEDAIAAARRYTESAGPLEQDATPTWVSYALARAKASREAEQLLARVPAGKRQAVAAAAWLALGKREEAFTVFRDGSSNVTVADVLLWWPVFDAVREEPEFKAMIAAMGFTEAHARAQAWRAAHPPEKVEVKK
jgi:tetratricopeptide (TPR) repeat protein